MSTATKLPLGSTRETIPFSSESQPPTLHDLSEAAWQRLELLITRNIEFAVRRLVEEFMLARNPLPVVPQAEHHKPTQERVKGQEAAQAPKAEEITADEEQSVPRPRRYLYGRYQIQDKEGKWVWED
jgi:hypothetical protein